MTTPRALRTAITDLAVLAGNDLDGLWRQVSTAEQARDALGDVLPVLVATYGLAASTITADWYDDVRDAVAARGRFTAIPALLDDTGTDALAGWAVDPLFKPEPDWPLAQVLVAGGMQRRIANHSRATVVDSSLADPAAGGWMRQGAGACAFCAMLIGRGAVYSEAGADFASHDHCHCSAVPAFDGQPRPVKSYTPSKRVASDADRARVRRYLAAN